MFFFNIAIDIADTESLHNQISPVASVHTSNVLHGASRSINVSLGCLQAQTSGQSLDKLFIFTAHQHDSGRRTPSQVQHEVLKNTSLQNVCRVLTVFFFISVHTYAQFPDENFSQRNFSDWRVSPVISIYLSFLSC